MITTANNKIKIPYQDYIYRIMLPNAVYIGQTARKTDSQRVWEHFGKNGFITKRYSSVPLAQIQITIYPGPSFGLAAESYNNFLERFEPLGGALRNSNKNTRASKIYKDEYVNSPLIFSNPKAFNSITVGTVVDIAEIMHIANWTYLYGASNIINKNIGGQQTSWVFSGTKTRAFKKSDQPQDVYKTIIAAHPLSLNDIQKVADTYVTRYWFQKGNGINDKSWNEAITAYNNGSIKTIGEVVAFAYIRQLSSNTNWLTGLRNHLQRYVQNTKCFLPNHTITISLKSQSQSENEISQLFENVLYSYFKTNNKNYNDLAEVEKNIKKAISFQSTGNKVTIPISMLFNIDINTNTPQISAVNIKALQNTTWWQNKIKQGVPVSENDKKLLAYEQFKEIYFIIADGSFYQTASVRNKMIQLKTNKSAFAIYSHQDPSLFLSNRMKEAYQTLGITKYNDKWNDFFKQMISLMPTKLTDVGYNSTRGSTLYSRDEIIVIDNKQYQVATFIPDGYLTPGQAFSLDKIKIY